MFFVAEYAFVVDAFLTPFTGQLFMKGGVYTGKQIPFEINQTVSSNQEYL